MKLVHYEVPGLPKVLKVIESHIPNPNENEVLIKVAAAGVNRPDLMQREGIYPAPKGHSKTLGLEVSGIIEKVGINVKSFKEGDKVCALLDGGGYAEFCVAKERQTVKFPTNLSFIEAAGIPECFMTCWSNIVNRGKLKKNQSVLIHGGTSGIGTTAIQILKIFDTKIFTTVGSDEKKEFCEKLGANFVINYNKEDFFEKIKNETNKKGVDIVLDMVGGEYTQKNIDLLSNDGTLINIAFQKGSKLNLNLMKVMLKRLTITGSTLRIRDSNFKERIIKDLQKFVFPYLLNGKIKPIIDSVYKIDDVVKAHEKLYKNNHIGKIILEMNNKIS
jgi:NADPH:quinone reductase